MQLASLRAKVALYPQGPKESIAHRRALVEWLRRELGMTE